MTGELNPGQYIQFKDVSLSFIVEVTKHSDADNVNVIGTIVTTNAPPGSHHYDGREDVWYKPVFKLCRKPDEPVDKLLKALDALERKQNDVRKVVRAFRNKKI